MNDLYRVEIDSLGEVQVPADRLYGAQTARALKHFAIGNEVMPNELIVALAIVKKAAAIINCELGKLPQNKMELIVKACDEIIAGNLAREFPLHIWQSGSGTQTNMNVNEVIANRAIQIAGGVLGSKNPIHPNDDVNMSQSTNDVFPTAMHVAAAIQIKKFLLPSLIELRNTFAEKEREFAGIVKIGRTHLQDATPLLLNQEFSGYRSLLDRNLRRLELVLVDLSDLAIGGTAVGTGISCHPEYAVRVCAKITELTNLPFKSHPNKFAALSAHDEIVFASGALRTTAVALMKIANDVRWLGSGPRCGLSELTLPANEPGSSIMPGKVNPTQCEAITMIATQVIGNDVTIGLAGSQGNFELNVFKPVLIYNFLQSLLLLKDGASCFAKYCIAGLQANRDRIAQYLNNSLMVVTALAPIIGYDRAAMIAHTAHKEDTSLKDACLKLGFLSEAEFDRVIRGAKLG